MRLIEAGLVVKASTGKRWIGINRSHAAYRSLEVLLDALVVTYGVKFEQQANRRRTLPGRTSPKTRPVDDHILGSHVRSLSVLLLGELGSGDPMQLARLLGKNYNSVLYTLDKLERQGIVIPIRQGEAAHLFPVR
jgi:hypothetical protein